MSRWKDERSMTDTASLELSVALKMPPPLHQREMQPHEVKTLQGKL